ncbi:MAG: RIP metalloprotease RseP [Clostridiales bacterium]|jgi:regulator of sigma E protease|nr:RIP metalloprotease RseP [Clostridiales bacterium]
MSIIIAILVFGAIVLIHELGHYWAARKCGVTVEEFAIGMGPKIFSWTKNNIVFSLRGIPIGGFCKMLGEDDESNDPGALNRKSIPQRTIILAAGAMMNLALAFIIFLFITLFSGFSTTTIHQTMPGSPAEAAGLRSGDRITRLNGTSVNIFGDVTFELSGNTGSPTEVTYVRDGQIHTTTITPYKAEDGSYKIGFLASGRTGLFEKRVEGYERAGAWESLTTSAFEIAFYVKVTIVSLVRLVTGQLDMGQLSGPIGIVSVIGEAYTESVKVSAWAVVLNMLSLCAILSANLGVFNLLPLPGLDGGRLAFVFVEAIRRKPLPVEKEGLVHFIGIVLLMILAVFIAFNDIKKLL